MEREGKKALRTSSCRATSGRVMSGDISHVSLRGAVPLGDATHCVSQRERKEKERQTTPWLLQIGKGDFLETEFSSCIKEGEDI